MSSPETWRWIWLAVTAAFVLGEMTVLGSFFLLPFGVGGAVAATLAFLDVGVAVEWLVFVVVSALAFTVLRRIASRLDVRHSAEGVGAGRWIGEQAIVVEGIPPGEAATGLIRIGGHEWRARSAYGHAIAAKSTVKILRIDGTKAVVLLLEEPAELE